MRLSAALLTLLVSGSLAAQSVDPPIAIYDGGSTRARGTIVIRNPGVLPVMFVLEPKGFAVACTGDVAFAPLDTTQIRLRLSAMSGRLAAKQRATIFYDVQVDSLPRWFAVVVSFSPGRADPGLSVRMEIPHIVYLQQRERVAREDVSITAATYDAASRALQITVANRSGKLTRIGELLAVSTRGREFSIDACPLFPASSRDFRFPWPDAEPPVKVIAKFSGFTLERAVEVIAPAVRPATPALAPSCAPCPPLW